MKFPPKLEHIIRTWLLKAAYPVLLRAGKIHAPFSHKLLRSKHYRDLKPRLSPGMVLISRTEGEFTNILIPGYWGHVAVCATETTVIEAVGAGVIETDLIDFLLTKDHVRVFASRFADQAEADKAMLWIRGKLGRPYDYTFGETTDAYYCAELPWAGYKAVLGEDMPFKPRSVLGDPTISPEDYDRLPDLWKEVWDSRQTVEPVAVVTIPASDTAKTAETVVIFPKAS